MSTRRQVGRSRGTAALTITVPRGFDSAREQRERVADEISDRLRKNGIRLFGKEALEELVDLLEAVERFEAAVERRGGDLMVDEPVNGIGPIAPDAAEHRLPSRRGRESVASLLARIEDAASALRRARPPRSASQRRS